MPRISQITEVTEYDGTTGEVTQHSTSRTYNVGEEPPFVKLYLADVLYLSDMPTQYASVLASLITRVSYAGAEDGMCITLAPHTRDSICKELGFKNRQSLANVLRKLVQGEILFNVGRGVYRLNPYLFGRGTWADIAKIRMEISYTLEGRKFQTTLEHKAKMRTEQREAEQRAIEARQRAQEAREAPEAPLPGQTYLEDVTRPTEAVEARQEARGA